MRLPRFVVLTGDVLPTAGGVDVVGPLCAVSLQDGHRAPIDRLLKEAGQVVDVRRLLASKARHGAREVRGLIVGLLEVGVLSAVVPALERIVVVGPAREARILCRALEGSVLPDTTASARVVLAGRLGSEGWLKVARRSPRGGGWTVPISWEREGSWVGPASRPGRAPCVRCLLLRREAVVPQSRADPVAFPPRPWPALAAAVLGLMESLSRDGGEVRFVTRTAMTEHRLLGSQLCERCAPTSRRPVNEQAARRGAAFEERWAQEPAAEPGAGIQAAFFDPMLASMYQRIESPRGGFRDLPLVVGGVSAHQWTPNGPVPLMVSNNLNGSGFSQNRRQLVQFSEGVERLALLTQRPDVQHLPEAGVSRFAVAPAQITAFSEAQQQSTGFPFARYTGQPLDWAWAYDLTAMRPCLLPFDAVAVGRALTGRSTRLMDEPFYTGGAAHLSVRRAVAHALFELIERDAFMLAWYLRLGLRELEVDAGALPPDADEALGFLRRRELQLRFYDLSVDFTVPTVLAVATATAAQGRWVRGGRILSGCAAPTATAAVSRCVSEILGQVTAVTGLAVGEPPTAVDAVDAGAGDDWRPVLERYLQQDVPEAFDFLGTAPEALGDRHSIPPDTDVANWLIAKLKDRGLRVCVRLLDAPDVRATGLSVVKVVIPGMIRPARTRSEVNFGSDRFRQVAARHGVELVLNPLEHPLA